MNQFEYKETKKEYLKNDDNKSNILFSNNKYLTNLN